MRNLRTGAILALSVVFIAGIGSPAKAQTVEWDSTAAPVSGQTGTESAKAVFSLLTGGSALKVVLTNTSTFAKFQNGDVITGFFFDIPGDPSVKASTSSAFATLGVNNPSLCTGHVTTCTGTNVNVGSRWEYAYSSTGFSGTGITGLTGSHYAATTSGYSGLTSPALTRSAMGSSSPALGAPGGQMNLGLVGPNYTDAASGNPVDKDVTTMSTVTLTFQFTTAQPSLNLANIDAVVMTYGTAPDSVVTGKKKAPEPSSIALFLVGALATGATSRWKSRRARP